MVRQATSMPRLGSICHWYCKKSLYNSDHSTAHSHAGMEGLAGHLSSHQDSVGGYPFYWWRVRTDWCGLEAANQINHSSWKLISCFEITEQIISHFWEIKSAHPIFPYLLFWLTDKLSCVILEIHGLSIYLFFRAISTRKIHNELSQFTKICNKILT